MPRTLEPLGDVSYEGLDVSAFQEDVDFSRVRAAGRTAVYIRSSVGTDYVDPRLESNYAGARDNGLLVGFYHCVTARNATEALAEARFFVDTLRGKRTDLCLAMDFEQFGELDDEQVNGIAQTFLNAIVRESGKEAVIYTGAYHARTLWSDALAARYPLWVAQHGAALPEYNDQWPGWVGFQYSARGRVRGISGCVSLDRFTRGILVSDAAALPGQPAPRPEPREKLIRITVRRGEPLTRLAAQYGVTVGALIHLNAIRDPDRIRAGEKLYVRVTADFPDQCCDTYTVHRGDTLWDIARRFDTTVARLAGVNKLSDPDALRPGQRLTLGLCG